MSRPEDDKHCVIHTQTQGGTKRSTKLDILISIDFVGPKWPWLIFDTDFTNWDIWLLFEFYFNIWCNLVMSFIFLLLLVIRYYCRRLNWWYMSWKYSSNVWCWFKASPGADSKQPRFWLLHSIFWSNPSYWSLGHIPLFYSSSIFPTQVPFFEFIVLYH